MESVSSLGNQIFERTLCLSVLLSSRPNSSLAFRFTFFPSSNPIIAPILEVIAAVPSRYGEEVFVNINVLSVRFRALKCESVVVVEVIDEWMSGGLK